MLKNRVSFWSKWGRHEKPQIMVGSVVGFLLSAGDGCDGRASSRTSGNRSASIRRSIDRA
jgi:hypothetical protein